MNVCAKEYKVFEKKNNTQIQEVWFWRFRWLGRCFFCPRLLVLVNRASPHRRRHRWSPASNWPCPAAYPLRWPSCPWPSRRQASARPQTSCCGRDRCRKRRAHMLALALMPPPPTISPVAGRRSACHEVAAAATLTTSIVSCVVAAWAFFGL